MKREDLVLSMQKHSFNLFPKEWYENVVDSVFLDIEGKTINGYVYFVKYRSSNTVKIGMSSNILNRIKSFQTNSSDDLFLIGFIYNKDYSKLERQLHLNLKEFRVSGEWFDIPLNEVINLINKHDGVVVNCKVDKKMIIEDGNVISVGDLKLNSVYDENILFHFFSKLEKGIRLHVDSIFNMIPKEDKTRFSKKKITTSLKKYASQNGIKYISGNSNGMRWFILE